METKQLITYLLLIIWLSAWPVSITSSMPTGPNARAHIDLVGRSADKPILEAVPASTDQPRSGQSLKPRHDESSSNSSSENKSATRRSPELQRLIYIASKTIKGHADSFSNRLQNLMRLAEANIDISSDENRAANRLTQDEMNTIHSIETATSPHRGESATSNHVNDSSAVLKAEQFNFTSACCLDLLERFIEAVN